MIKYLNIIITIIFLSQTQLFAKNINIDKMIQDNKKTNKNVLVYLHRIGCSYCNSMQEFTLDDDDVKEFIRDNYIFVSVNISLTDTLTYKKRQTSALEFAKNIGYNFYPSTLFLDKNGNLEYASVGYKDEFDFRVILKYVKHRFFKTMTLKEYKKSIGFKKKSGALIIEDKRIHER